MPITIFNPPCPHAHPVLGGGIRRDGQRCGNCLCVPPFWKLICGVVSGAYVAMGGTFLLPRLIKEFVTDNQADCAWRVPVQLDPHSSNLFAYWSLYYGSYGSGFTTNNQWFAVANMSQFNQNDINTWGPNAIAAQPPLRGGHWETHNWNCLGPNTMQVYDGGLGFPNTIIVQPFWP